MYFSNAPFKVSLLAAAIALTGCGGDSSSSGGGSDEPRDGSETGTPVSGFTISAQGGESKYNAGGNGGDIEIQKFSGSSDIEIKKEGEVNVEYTLPAQEADFGSNPVTLTTATSVKSLDDDASIPLAGELYMVPEESKRLYKSSGIGAIATDDQEVTGIKIEEGGMLILPHGESYSDSAQATLFLRADLQNDGSIRAEFQTDDEERVESAYAIDISIIAAAYYGAGDILTNGDAGIYRGQNGGNISISAHTIQTSGTLNTSAAGQGNSEDEVTGSNNGGSAGYVTLSAEIFVENKGQIIANGSAAKEDNMTLGEGGQVTIEAIEVYNSGEIVANPGTVTSTGNHSYDFDDLDDDDASNFIHLVASRSLINTANLSALGANSTGDDGTYTAGRGGEIKLEILKNNSPESNWDGKFVNTGTLNVSGGDVKGSSDGQAGTGGLIRISIEGISIDGGPSGLGQIYSGDTKVMISGNLLANGGGTSTVNYKDDGESVAGAGARGGDIDISVVGALGTDAVVKMVGYDSIITNAGSGMSGAAAGDVDIISADFGDELAFVQPAVGNIELQTDILAIGSDALADAVETDATEQSGSGGSGGNITIGGSSLGADLHSGVSISASGTISANGGRGYNDSSMMSAQGGDVSFVANNDIVVTGAITLDGGYDAYVSDSDENTNQTGSNGGSLTLSSAYTSSDFNATLNANGGAGAVRGGNAGDAFFFGKTAVNVAGEINLHGGDANTSGETDNSVYTIGGDAGNVGLLSGEYNSELTATVNADAGNGDEAGEGKVIVVDADCMTDDASCSQDEPEPILDSREK